MELPSELKNTIEKYKYLYRLDGTDSDILKKIIPSLSDKDILELYEELCAKEKEIHHSQNYRPNFEKYREEILEYLDDNIVKSEIIRREQKQWAKNDLKQRNYIFISELATTLDNKPDKMKIIRSFYRKIKQLESERNLLDVKGTIDNIELSIHIYNCILHICEKMSIDLELYRGFNGKKKYKLKQHVDFIKLKYKRKKQSKEQNQLHLKNLYFNQIIKQINDLKTELQELKKQEENKNLEELR